MLITFFLNLIYNIVNSFLGLFSNADTAFLTNIGTAASTTSSYLSAVSAFAPISTILTIVGLFLIIELAILIIKIVNWIIRKIPTIN